MRLCLDICAVTDGKRQLSSKGLRLPGTLRTIGYPVRFSHMDKGEPTQVLT